MGVNMESPLHGWCWSIVKEVLKPVGELISLSQATIPHKKFISTLVVQLRLDDTMHQKSPPVTRLMLVGLMGALMTSVQGLVD